MTAPSLVSEVSGSIASSKLASCPSLFLSWMRRARVALMESAPEDVMSQFDNLCQFKVPRALYEGTLPTPGYETEAEFQRIIRAWAANVPHTEGDEYHILEEMHALALAHYRIQTTSNNYTKEHSKRRGIDDILEIAFSSRIGRRCKFTTEEHYRLVELDSNPNAQSDTLIIIPSQETADKLQLLQYTFTQPAVIDHLYWSTNGVQDPFSVIVFAGEFKEDEESYNRNQLIMVLTTAQSQRKALSLKKSVIMGATGCRGRVQIYSSYWNDDDTVIQIHKHTKLFDLMNPIDVIRLYVFV